MKQQMGFLDGIQTVREAFLAYRLSSFFWAKQGFLYFLLLFLLNAFNLIGFFISPIVFLILQPILAIGFLKLVHRQHVGDTPGKWDFFAGFGLPFLYQLGLGLLNFLVFFLSFVCVVLWLDFSVLSAEMLPESKDQMILGLSSGGLFRFMGYFSLLYFGLQALLLFLPALLLFGKTSGQGVFFKALTISAMKSLSSYRLLLGYGVAMGGVIIGIPMALGAVLWLLPNALLLLISLHWVYFCLFAVPLWYIGVYLLYQRIFLQPE